MELKLVLWVIKSIVDKFIIQLSTFAQLLKESDYYINETNYRKISI